jgi:hypothetical protein
VSCPVNLTESTVGAVGIAAPSSAEDKSVTPGTQPDHQSTKSTLSDVCPACFRSECLVFRNVPPIEPDDVFEVDYRSLRAITGQLDRRHRVAVRNVITNRLSYMDAFKLTRFARRSELLVRNAAPDLLVVAKMIDDCYREGIGASPLLTDPESPLVKKARAAIAKAEGR